MKSFIHFNKRYYSHHEVKSENMIEKIIVQLTSLQYRNKIEYLKVHSKTLKVKT